MSSDISIEFSKLEWLFYTSCSILFFIFYNLFCSYLLRKFEFLRTHWNFWRFKNTFISWNHAILAVILFIINVYQEPELLHDMIGVSTKFSYIAICISKGYFMYDAIDILYSNKKLSTQSKEVLLHHGLIIFIFSITLSLNRYVGYTTGALSIEFNTVFLHLRFLTVFCDIDKSSLSFRALIILNLITFFVFRILTLCWMTRWILLNRHLIPLVWFSIGSTGLVIMMVINIFLLKRLVESDFSKITNSSVKNGTEPIVKTD